MPQIDWKFNIGQIITIATLLIGGAMTYSRLDARVTVIEERGPVSLQQSVAALNTNVAVLTTEVKSLREQIAELRAQISK
jgi:cell division protein FtsB